MPRAMFVAGEASGDLHGGGVARELKRLAPEIELFGIGGDAMQAAGVRLLHHAREMSVLGFAEVLRHIPFFRQALRECARELRDSKPCVLVLIDYPGFNLKLARIAHERGVPVVYYISPQVWAWRASRLKKMKGVVDKMLVIFPFEVALYQREGIPVEFVGHPLLEHDDGGNAGGSKNVFFARHGFDPAKPLIGLFPGSRKQEIERMLPVFLDAAEQIRRATHAQFAVAAAPGLPVDFIQPFLGSTGIPLLQNQTAVLQRHADLAIAKSGTTTLELAIAGTPMVVAYKTSALSYRIGKSLAKVGMIAMPNIIAGEKIVPEFIQNDATPKNIARAAIALLTDSALRDKTKRNLAGVRAQLGMPGASRRAAEVIAGYCTQ